MSVNDHESPQVLVWDYRCIQQVGRFADVDSTSDEDWLCVKLTRVCDSQEQTRRAVTVSCLSLVLLGADIMASFSTPCFVISLPLSQDLSSFGFLT